jgi:hypothetical protein
VLFSHRSALKPVCKHLCQFDPNNLTVVSATMVVSAAMVVSLATVVSFRTTKVSTTSFLSMRVSVATLVSPISSLRDAHAPNPMRSTAAPIVLRPAAQSQTLPIDKGLLRTTINLSLAGLRAPSGPADQLVGYASED